MYAIVYYLNKYRVASFVNICFHDGMNSLIHPNSSIVGLQVLFPSWQCYNNGQIEKNTPVNLGFLLNKHLEIKSEML